MSQPNTPNCLACVHCAFDPGCEAYSEVTPGDPMILRCRKGRWDFYAEDTRQAIFEKAKGCEDFEPEKWAQ